MAFCELNILAINQSSRPKRTLVSSHQYILNIPALARLSAFHDLKAEFFSHAAFQIAAHSKLEPKPALPDYNSSLVASTGA
jgi:hypothetical protein